MSEYDIREQLPGSNIPYLKIAIGIVVLLVLYNSYAVIGAGERGVVFSKVGGIQDRILDEGIRFKTPFIEDVIPVDVKIKKAETAATASTKDLQTVSSTIALNYHVDPGRVNTVYQEIGIFYKERVIDPAVQEAVKAVSAQYTAEELITRRADVKDEIKASLTQRLLNFNMIVDEFNIVDFAFSNNFNTAIEAKQMAEQQALKAQRDLERIRIEAEQKMAHPPRPRPSPSGCSVPRSRRPCFNSVRSRNGTAISPGHRPGHALHRYKDARGPDRYR